MAKVSSCKDLLMLLLYAKGHGGLQAEPVKGRTRLMKMVFLFEKEVRAKFNLDKVISKEALPDFTPYDFGPFSPAVYSDLEFLVELGFVERQQSDDLEPLEEEALEYEYWQAGAASDASRESLQAQEEFVLSSIGKEFVQAGHAGRLSEAQWQVLDEFKARCTGTSLRALLRYVYTRYKDMTVKSKIREEILSAGEN